AALNALTPLEQRGGVASSFFVVLYCALALPVVAAGLAIQLVGLRITGITFGVIVTAICAGVVLSLRRSVTPTPARSSGPG
ncbi:MAG: MFS transporter, partial [Candidatus Dormibacteria bacterium]